jgi:metallo-beta-lactamase class B
MDPCRRIVTGISCAAKSLSCDIYLGAHAMYFDLKKKYTSMNNSQSNPFVDPKGYQNDIAQKEKDFDNKLKKQQTS